MPIPLEISIAHGLCWCGCNRFAPIAKRTYGRISIVKGEPVRYIVGHAGHEGLPRPVLGETSIFKIDGVYCRLIPLTRGLWAIVDAADYEWLTRWKWQAHWNNHTKSFYARRVERGPDGKRYVVYMHRAILCLERGDPLNGDHRRNKCGTDNRRKNLRPADDDENAQNASLRKDNTSGTKGVYWYRRTQKWAASIRVKGKLIHLGYFIRFEDAKAARLKAAFEYFGEFANFD